MSQPVSPPPSAPAFTLGELAQRFELQCRADSDITINGVAPLHRAGPGEISFLVNPRYRTGLEQCRAGAVVMDQDSAAVWDGPSLISSQPYADFARIAALFEIQPHYVAGIHPHATVHPSATIGAGSAIAAGAVIGSGVTIGEQCIIGPGCVVEDNARIGAHSRLVSRVSIGHGCHIGERALIHPGVVIGGDGFGQAWTGAHWVKVPQLGNVIIGNDVEIGANTTIDRGALDATVIEDGVRIDNLVQIAHNVHIGAHTAIAACVGIAGSARIGRYCLIGGAAAILGHIQLCDRVIVQGMSSITHSITEPGEYGSAVAAQEVRQWRRNLARLRNLDQSLRELGKAIKKTALRTPESPDASAEDSVPRPPRHSKKQ